MPLTQTRILEILASGNFESLVGEFESETLECKGQPYGLETDERKLELAKDVSGMANASGGTLLVGFSTTKSATHGEDEIDQVRAFPLTRFNPDQYRQVIASWLWPPLENVTVQVFPSASEPSHGVAAIVIPAAEHTVRPVLVAKTVLDSPRRVELLFGYCERKQVRVTHYDVERLHALLRDGRRLDTEIREGFDSLHSAVEGLRNLMPSEPPTVLPTDVSDRIDKALQAVRLHEEGAFILVAVPRRTLDLRGLFESRNNALVQLLERPPEIRSSGFDLNSGGNSKIVGRLRRSVAENYRLLEAHRDGVVIFVASGERLCWGRERRQRDRLIVNQLALVEMTYLFYLLVNSNPERRSSCNFKFIVLIQAIVPSCLSQDQLIGSELWKFDKRQIAHCLLAQK